MRGSALLLFGLLAACAPTPTTIPDPSLDGPRTWYGVVGPLVLTRCATCHRSDEIGPFPLETYDQAKAMAVSMEAQVRAKNMPPFPPEQSDESGCPRIDDVRRMSDAERDVLLEWLGNGTPEGDVRELPATPKNEPLGPPSDTFEMAEAYDSTATGPDDYRCFVIEPKVLTSIPVGAVSVLPGNRTVTHHAAVYLIPPEQMTQVRDLDKNEAGQGYTCFGGVGVSPAYPTGLWVPGNDAPLVPPGGGVGYYLLPGWGFVVQMHYNYAHGKQSDKSSVVMWRANAIVTEVPHAMVLGKLDFSIPPNMLGYSAEGTGEFIAGTPGAVLNEANGGRIYSVWAHQHTLGKSFEMTLERADGTTQCLLKIPKWDFNWQSIYKLKDFVEAKPGDKVKFKCTWDNTTTRTVTYGEGTADEMCLGSLALLH